MALVRLKLTVLETAKIVIFDGPKILNFPEVQYQEQPRR